jgi:hypothetical protein
MIRMLSAKALFRLLVVVTFVAPFLSFALPTGNISEDWRTVGEWHGNGGFWLDLIAYVSGLEGARCIAAIAALVALAGLVLGLGVGLFLFWRPARLANLLIALYVILVAPWSGLVVLFPLEVALADFRMLCEGAVIALSFTPPIKDYFERTGPARSDVNEQDQYRQEK